MTRRCVVPDRVGLAGLAAGQAEDDRLGQVVDVEGKHQAVAATGHGELPGPCQLEWPKGPRHRAWPVDVAGTDHDRAAPARQSVGGRLCVYVRDSVGAAKRPLVLLGPALISVDDDRAQVNDTVRAGLGGRVEDVRGAGHVDSNEIVHGAPFVNVGGGVDDQLGLVECRFQRLPVGRRRPPRRRLRPP